MTLLYTQILHKNESFEGKKDRRMYISFEMNFLQEDAYEFSY